MPVGEVSTRYGARPAGSASQAAHLPRRAAHPAHDRLRWCKEERPLQFFSVMRRWFCCCSAWRSALPVVLEFLRTGLVPRLPTAVLAVGLVVLAFLSFAVGLILDSVSRGRREAKRLAYLALPAPPSPAPALAPAAFQAAS